MKTKATLLSIFLVLCMGFWSCSNDDPSDGPSGNVPCSDFLTEFEQVNAAQTAFSQNPTSENCETLKNAWLNFFEEFQDCPYWEEGNYQDTINEIETMDCTDL